MTTQRPARVRHLLSALALALLSATLLLGCDSQNSLADPAVSFTGTWEVTATVVDGTNEGALIPVTVIVVQTGDQATATWSSPAGIAGELHGVVGGRQLSFQMSQDPPCTGAFFGDAWIDENDELVGRYQGRACQGDLTAELAGTRG